MYNGVLVSGNQEQHDSVLFCFLIRLYSSMLLQNIKYS